MLDLINSVILSITDPVMNWLLFLPRDVAVAIVAVGTAFILTIVRPWTTNQNLLKRCDTDKKRLNELIKEAKKAKDKDAIARHQATVGMIAMKMMKAEGKPLIISLLPVALLAVWCWARIGYYPPEDLKPVELIAYFPASEIGEVVHLMPEEGLRAMKWIARVEDTPDAIPGQEGMAVWKIKGKARKDEPYSLKMVCKGKVHEMKFLVGSRKYSPNIKFFKGDGDLITVADVMLKPFWFFGKLHIPWWGLDYIIFPWLLAYLLIAIPFVFILKSMFDIH